MTKEQELAKEAGFHLDGMPNMLFTVRGNHAQLERLIKLVRNAAVQDERTALAELCDAMGIPQIAKYLREQAAAIESIKEPTP